MIARIATFLLCLAMAACATGAAPASGSDTASPGGTTSIAAPVSSGGAPSCPIAAAASTPASGKPACGIDPAQMRPDRSCKVDADCQVKNVGNCCGESPMCVNHQAKVDPKGVRAWCASMEMVSTCHVMAISGCSCVQGQCGDINAGPLPARH